MGKRLVLLVVALFLLAVVPDVAHACPVCFDPREENRLAFLATTVFMSLFPLSIVGGFGAWLRKRARAESGDTPDEEDTPGGMEG
jgi:hypothetical protein